MKDISKWVSPQKFLGMVEIHPKITEIAVSKNIYNSIISHWSGQMMLWYLFLPRWGCNEKNHTYNPKHQQTFSDKIQTVWFSTSIFTFAHANVCSHLLPLPETSLSVFNSFNGHTYQRPKTPCAHWYGGWTKSKSPAPKNNAEKKRPR